MKFKQYSIENKSLQELTDNELQKLIDFLQKRSSEISPKDPPLSREVRRK